MTPTVLDIEITDHVATLWLDRPEARNAMNAAMWREIPEAMAELSDDPDVRVVVIAARGPAFTVGLDLKEFGPALASGFGSTDQSPAAARMATYRKVKELQHTFTAIADCPKPVIAAVHGYCLGAGVDLITACDLRMASADAIFSIRETKVGLVADVGTLQRLPKILNPGWVADLAFTGRDVPADEAEKIGLVNAVAPDADALHKAAHAKAAEIAANSPLVVQGIKAVLRAGEGRSIPEALDYVALWNAAFLQSHDLMEGVMALMQKRPPQFKGE